MKKKYPSINSIVEYGLDSIDPTLTLQVNLKELLYIYKAVEELNRYFHQPGHFKKIEDLKKYLGDRNEGAYAIISNIYYKIFENMLPSDIKDIVENDDFHHPDFPFYYFE